MRKKIFPLILIFLGVGIAVSTGFSQRVQLPKIDISTEYLNCVHKKDKKQIGECLRELSVQLNKGFTFEEIDPAIRTVQNNTDIQWCHEFMHYLGWELFNQKQNLFDAFTVASNLCDSGMFHGAAEEFMNQQSTKYSPEELAQTVIPTACEEGFQNDTTTGTKSLCYHGLGHAFMFITDNELNKSLKYCDLVKDGYEMSCFSGALMENVQSKQVGRKGSHASEYSYDREKPDFPCDTLDIAYKRDCYSYKGVHAFLEANTDVKTAVQECLKVQKEYQGMCFWGIGSNIPGPHMKTADAARLCKDALPVNKQAYIECIDGAMSFLMQLHTGDPTAAKEFCDNTDSQFVNHCYYSAGHKFTSWISSTETLADKCKIFQSTTAQTTCVNAPKQGISY